jgi:hypothetical protein
MNYWLKSIGFREFLQAWIMGRGYPEGYQNIY